MEVRVGVKVKTILFLWNETEKIVDKVNIVNWKHVIDSVNDQEAYTLFHVQLLNIYNACFLLRRLIRNILPVNLG